MTEGEKLKVQINHLRKMLDTLIENTEEPVLIKEGLIKLSKELDELIVYYTRWKKENGKRNS